MKKLISCAFNIDTACVELRFTDGSICSIDCTAVENEVADNRFQRAELDYLIYNDPLAYADLVLNGDVEAYLNAVTEYQTSKNEYEKGVRRAHSLTFSCRLSVLFSCVFSVFLLVPRRQFRLPFVTFVVRLDHGQQAAGDAFNGVIRDLHATVFPTAEC